MEKIQKENKKLLRSVTELQHEVRQLKELLAEKDEQLSRTIKRRQIRTVAHVDTLTQLNQTRADLKVSQEKCTYLEEKLQTATNDSHQSPEHGDHVRGQQSEKAATCIIELSKKEEALKLQFLEKEKQMEAWMRERLISMQEAFQKKLLEEREKNHREMSEREERLRQQLERGMREERDVCLKKQLSTFIEYWQTDTQQWKKHQLELQEKLQERESLRKQQEEERKQESECIQENFQQLWNYIEKKEKKKKRKGVWSRIQNFWKNSFPLYLSATPTSSGQLHSPFSSAAAHPRPCLSSFCLPRLFPRKPACFLSPTTHSASVAPAIICFPGFDSSAWPQLVCCSPLIGTSAARPSSVPLPCRPALDPSPQPFHQE
ncbi:hypothetical protein D4764_13G0011700 [Takifugu flavidus]|uniref:Uncharacterized protein n=1 Tax=Takifugu flavidus TaxID=433684 RepID=A0A5C6PCY3_9TELE|nr:hypothetical protein D4764_13G0011700 [Takifugu flavidus]